MIVLYLFISICLADWVPSNYISGKDPRLAVPFCASAENEVCKSCDNGFKLVDGSCVFDGAANCPNTVYATHYESGNKCSYCPDGQEYEAGGCKCKNGMGADCTKCISENEGDVCDACVYGMALSGADCVDITSLGHISNLNEKNCISLFVDTDSKVKCDRCFGNKALLDGACATDVSKIPNCINQIGSVCSTCKDGYFLNGVSCDEAPPQCLTVTNKVCTKCLEGYVLVGAQCHVCQIDLPSTTGDECSIYSTANCTSCNKYCKVKDGACVKNHCDLFGSGGAGGSEGECVRCEDGYFLVSGECIEYMYDGFTSSDKTACLPGYYLEIDKSTTPEGKRCVHCEGQFIECISETIPVPGKINLRVSHLTDPTPCQNPFCLSCSNDNSYCFRCESPATLVGGRCLLNNAIEVSTMVNAYKFMACRVRGYEGYDEFLSGFNSTVYKTTYCIPQKPYLPYYFKVDESGVSCFGSNRDIKNECNCNNGHIATSADKTTDCSPITLDGCEETANDKICLKCPIGAYVNTDGKCKCPDTYYSLNGECVKCPSKCISCESDGSGGVKCNKCYETNQEITTRDISKQCACLSSYVEGPEVNPPYYGCALTNERCNNLGEGVSYKVSEGYWRCSVCDDPAYIPSTAYITNSDCTECSPSAFASGVGECKLCSEIQLGCSACQASGCTECLDSNLLASSNCTTCTTTDYYVDPSDKTKCTQCPVKCNGCTYNEEKGEVWCIACSSSVTGITAPYCACGDTSVTLTDGKCKDCESDPKWSNVCDITVEGHPCDYDYSTGFVHCYKCTENYNKRVASSNCTLCKSGFYPTEDNLLTTGGCESCNATCATCSNSSACITCTDTTKQGANCDICKKGYYKEGNNCIKCTNYCSECTSDTSCTSCESSIYVVVPGKGCNGCADGYYFDEVRKVCVPCESGCLKCMGITVDCNPDNDTECQPTLNKTEHYCKKCEAKNYISEYPVNGECVCEKGYDFYQEEGQTKATCQSCRLKADEFCSSCSNTTCAECNAQYLKVEGGKCVCVDGYYTTSWGSCVPCSRHMPHCTTCSAKQQCTKCEDGWDLKDGLCSGVVEITMLLVLLLAFLF